MNNPKKRKTDTNDTNHMISIISFFKDLGDKYAEANCMAL